MVEALVAIAVLLMAIIGPLTIASDSLRTASSTRDEVTAYYLADEGMETIRNDRDTNTLSALNWLGDLSHPSTYIGQCVGVSCTVDAPQNTINVCSGTCPALKYDSVNGWYTYQSGSASIFTRTINITSLSTHEIEVAITITWAEHNVPYTYSVRDNFLDWQQ